MRLRLAAVAAAVLILPATPATARAPQPDPTAPGPHAYRVVDYDAGATLIADPGGREAKQERLWGTLYVPEGPGPFPVVLFQHGVGAECAPGAMPPLDCERIPSHRGYDYLAGNLASHGYLAVSVVRSFRSGGPGVGVGGDLTNDEGISAELLARTLDLLAAWHGGAGPGAVGTSLAGRVDLGRIGAVGHSRGGGAVTRLVEHARTRDGATYEVDAVIALAPTDSTGLAPHGAAYAVVLPMCDADVDRMDGAVLWDRGRFADPAERFPRSQFTVRGANHLFFNTVWTWPDGPGGAVHDDADFYDGVVYEEDTACSKWLPTSNRLTPEEQQRVALTLVASFLRRHLGGEAAFDPVLTGARELPPVRTSYLAAAPERALVVTPEPGAGALTATAGGDRLDLAGFAEARVCDPAPPDPGPLSGPSRLVRQYERRYALAPTCPSDPTYGAARQLVLRWDGPAVLAAGLGGAFDATRFTALTFRTGVNFPEHGSPAPRVDVVLRDTAGRTAAVVANDHTTALQVPDGSSQRRLLLNGVRVPLAAFRGVGLDRLAAVELRFGATGPGSVQLAELAFQVS